MTRCPNCNEENPDRFRVCGFCGTPLAAQIAPIELRKTVTILFSDLKGSTSLGERLDPESLRAVLDRYFAEMKRAIDRHGGTIEKYIGDAIMAVFGIPRLHDDDALRAVRAAWDMRSALKDLNVDLAARWGVTLANRTGVNTGQVVTGDASSGQRLVTGDTVNVAARLEQAAPELEVLIGEPTWRLTRDAIEAEQVEPLELKGKSERVRAYRLTGVRAGRAEGFTRRLDAPLVGRSEELAALGASLRSAAETGRCHVVTVLGHAGLGKTRLVEEWVARAAREATALRGRCLPYGERITFWPLAEVVRQAAGIAEDDPVPDARAKLAARVGDQADVAERLAAVTGLSDEDFGVRETFWAARKLFEALSRERPLIVHFEDVHWAEPTFLELVQHVAETAEDARTVIVCTARPEFLEEHPKWLDGRETATRLVLAPLSSDDSDRIADAILGRTDLPRAARDRIARAAEGNPLFVEQTISMLVDEGALVPDASGSWTFVGEASALSVPPSIAALLSARLDRLGREDRTIIEAGSIPGPIFHRGAVTHLSPEPVRPTVADRLTGLGSKLLITPVAPTLVEDDAYRFQHILIREAAYDALLKRVRAEMHEKYVEWLEGVVGPSSMDIEEIVGYHLEQAFRYRTELAPADDVARRIAGRASAKLAVAGRRALARGDMPAAADLLQRAIALLPEDDVSRLDLTLDLSDARLEMGQLKVADELLSSATARAAERGDERRALSLRLAHLMVQRALGARWTEAGLQQVQDAIPVFEAAGDHAALARAWRVLATAHGSSSRYAAAEEATRHAVDEARLAGDRRYETRGLTGLALVALLGPLPVTEAIPLCERLVEQAAGDQRVQAQIKVILAELHARDGAFDEARRLYESANASLLDLGATLQAAATSLSAARVELLADRPDRAEAILRASYDTLRAFGEKSFITSVAAVLAESLAFQRRDAEADELATQVERTAVPGDMDAQFRWRLVRAELLAREGRYDDAVARAREAVDLMRRTDAPAKLGGALLVLAGVLRDASLIDDALATAREAHALFAAKGDQVSREKMSAILAGLEAGVLARQVPSGS